MFYFVYIVFIVCISSYFTYASSYIVHLPVQLLVQLLCCPVINILTVLGIGFYGKLNDDDDDDNDDDEVLNVASCKMILQTAAESCLISGPAQSDPPIPDAVRRPRRAACRSAVD